MHVIIYALWLIKEIFVSGFGVVAKAFNPTTGFKPVIVYYPLRVSSRRDLFWFSTSITATPSTLALGFREPVEPGGPRLLIVQDAFGGDPADIIAGLADMEERLQPKVKGVDHGVPGQGSAMTVSDGYVIDYLPKEPK